MTRTRYLIAALLQNFGVLRKNKRMSDASYEMQLMQDGEEILGAYCWQNTEKIDDVSSEYWRLRGLAKEKEELVNRVRKAETILADAHRTKIDVLNSNRERETPLTQRREELADSLKSLKSEYEEVMSRALSTKKRHGALKLKLQFLQSEGNAEADDIQDCLSNLSSLRNDFMAEKDELEKVKQSIASVEEEIAELKSGGRRKFAPSDSETGEAYAQISRANKEVASAQVKLSEIEEEQAKLYRNIGHYLNLNGKARESLTACRAHRPLLSQIQLLRQSIKRNRRLMERIGH